MSADLQIKIRMEGLDSENGHVRLEDFLRELQLIQQTMRRVDKTIDGTVSAYFRIVDASHSSPLVITLEPARNITKNHVPTEKRIREFHHKYFRELASIEKGQPPSDDLDDATLHLLDEVAKGSGKRFKTLQIKNNESEVGIDETFKKSVNTLLTQQTIAYGSLTGKLDALNVHDDRSNTIWLYPSTGPTRVSCRIPARFKDEVRNSVRKVVTVYGRKYYRSGSIHPHRIDVEKFEGQSTPDQSSHISQLKGAFKDKDGGIDAVQLINGERHEWD